MPELAADGSWLSSYSVEICISLKSTVIGSACEIRSNPSIPAAHLLSPVLTLRRTVAGERTTLFPRTVSQAVGFIKGKCAIHLARVYGERKQNYAGESFRARGYFVSTVGRGEATIREYIRSQEKEDERLDQMNLWR